MTRLFLLAALLVAPLVSSCQHRIAEASARVVERGDRIHPLANGAAESATIVFRHVNVVPMDREAILLDQDVVVEDGKIASIVRGGTARTGGKEIDGRGQFLLPGLVDFHTHPETPQELTLYLASGVTTIAALGGELLEWRRTGQEIDPLTPHIISTTRTLDGPSSSSNYGIRQKEDVPQILDHELARGAVMVKSYSSMPLPQFEALVAESRRRGVPLVGHVPMGVPMEVGLSGGLDMLAHSEELTRYLDWRSSPADLASTIDLLVANGVVVTPTLAVIDNIEEHAIELTAVLADPIVGHLAPARYQKWQPRNNTYANRQNLPAFVSAVASQYELQKSLVRRMDAAGVLLLAGTDAPITCVPGDCIYEELRLLSEAGLTNYEVLRTATYNAGLFGEREAPTLIAAPFGGIRPGARADLLLMPGNPLKNLAAVEAFSGLAIGGVWRSREELTDLKNAVLAKHRLQHRMVDTYERLYTSGDIPGLLTF